MDLTSLADGIEGALRRLVRPGRPAVLMAPPNHLNAGDSAIWLGARRALAGLGVRTLAVSRGSRYRAEDVQAFGGDIYLTGGGDLGDVWPGVQLTREAVISGFPDRRIVQLPQSIHFADPGNRSRAKRVLESHPDLTLLVRDRQSFEEARSSFDVPVQLAPDMALSLRSLRRPRPPDVDVLWLCREDLESRGSALPALPAGVMRLDWMGPVAHRPQRRARMAAAYRAERWLDRATRGPSLAARNAARLRSRAADRLAGERVLRGCAILARGRVVITDRLHGHILCLLMGIPHVWLDNSYGKVSSFVDTWTHDQPLARRADDPHDAVAMATEMARGAAPERRPGR